MVNEANGYYSLVARTARQPCEAIIEIELLVERLVSTIAK